MNFPAILSRLSNKEDLDEASSGSLIQAVISGELSDARVAAALMALNHKGVSALELSVFARCLREAAVQVRPRVKGLFDTCGTGGDNSRTFNISTVAAFVLAACKIPVAKHGNRSVSSRCGSADVLEYLGVNIKASPAQVTRCIEEVGIGFLFAPNHHPAFKNVGNIRRELGVPTVFNMLGPLLNPAGITAQVVGVYHPSLTELFAHTLKKLGMKNAMVVHGNGLDELTLCGASRITRLQSGSIETGRIHPADAGLDPCSLDDLKVEGIEDNARIFMDILRGSNSCRRDIVLLNSAAGLVTAQKASTFKNGVTMAAEAIDSGRALNKFEQFRRFSNDLG